MKKYSKTTRKYVLKTRTEGPLNAPRGKKKRAPKKTQKRTEGQLTHSERQMTWHCHTRKLLTQQGPARPPAPLPACLLACLPMPGKAVGMGMLWGCGEGTEPGSTSSGSHSSADGQKKKQTRRKKGRSRRKKMNKRKDEQHSGGKGGLLEEQKKTWMGESTSNQSQVGNGGGSDCSVQDRPTP